MQLHGRGPDVPLAYVSYTFEPPKENKARNSDLIGIFPWLRGNGEWRNENGSEPDVWEAIEDVKALQRRTRTVGTSPAIRGEATTHGQLPNAHPIYGRLLESWQETRLVLRMPWVW